MSAAQEFYDALKSNCLLNEEQLQAAFLNLPELISVSSYFTKRLQATTGLDRRNEPLDYKVNYSVYLMYIFLRIYSLLLSASPRKKKKKIY